MYTYPKERCKLVTTSLLKHDRNSEAECLLAVILQFHTKFGYRLVLQYSTRAGTLFAATSDTTRIPHFLLCISFIELMEN